ncbi:MAG: DegV family protein [Thermotogota bacterium]|nr:DegV family protein [Thermotogota bacterium]
MEKVKIVVDSTGDMPFEWIELLDVETIPLHILWGGAKTEKDIRDENEITDFWARIKRTEKLPTTSQPTPEEFSVLYNRIFEKGYDAIFVITISSKLSGTYNSARVAAKKHDKPIEIWDSRMASSPLALAAFRAKELADAGKNIREIKEVLEKERNEKQFLAFIYVNDFLRKGGRVSRFQNFVGTILKLRVAVYVDVNGELLPFGKASGSSRAQRMICRKLSKFIPKGSSVKLAMIHADNLKECRKIEEILNEHYNVLDRVYTPMGKVLTSHLGPLSAGFGVYWVK